MGGNNNVIMLVIQIDHNIFFILSRLTSGRILNRFSKDIGQLDANMPWIFVDIIQVKS